MVDVDFELMVDMTVDQAIGQRVRARRTELNMTLDELAGRTGITASDLDAHERGDKRIGAAELFQLCRVLEVSPTYLFDCL